MIKGPIHQKDKILNTYTPYIGAPKCIKQILRDLKQEIDNNSNSRGLQNPTFSNG